MTDNTEQDQIVAEIGALHTTATAAAGPLPVHALRDFGPYRSSALRHPTHELVRADPEEIELRATSPSSTTASRSASASS